MNKLMYRFVATTKKEKKKERKKEIDLFLDTVCPLMASRVTRAISASLPLKGQVTKHTTVERELQGFLIAIIFIFAHRAGGLWVIVRRAKQVSFIEFEYLSCKY